VLLELTGGVLDGRLLRPCSRIAHRVGQSVRCRGTSEPQRRQLPRRRTAHRSINVVSERRGHASVMITLDTSSHILPSMQEDAANSVAKLILEG